MVWNIGKTAGPDGGWGNAQLLRANGCFA